MLALTGADTGATVDGEAVPCWTSFVLREGQTLACGLAQSGARAYLAVHGGIDVPLYRGSRATHVSGGFGGLEGRPLAKGDHLPVGAATAAAAELAGRRLRPDLIPGYAPPMQVRTVAGPEEHHFTATASRPSTPPPGSSTPRRTARGCASSGRSSPSSRGARTI